MVKTVLDEAAEVTSNDRRRYYGHPRDNHGCTADLWSAYLRRVLLASLPSLGLPLDDEDTIRAVLPQLVALGARDVCWLNILQKASRDANRPHRDNLVDCAGYARNAEMVEEPA